MIKTGFLSFIRHFLVYIMSIRLFLITILLITMLKNTIAHLQYIGTYYSEVLFATPMKSG